MCFSEANIACADVQIVGTIDMVLAAHQIQEDGWVGMGEVWAGLQEFAVQAVHGSA